MCNHEHSIACDMSALPDRHHHETIGTQLLSQTLSVHALDNGYQLEFPVTALTMVAEFVDGRTALLPIFPLQHSGGTGSQHRATATHRRRRRKRNTGT